jgi:hypothetical protein
MVDDRSAHSGTSEREASGLMAGSGPQWTVAPRDYFVDCKIECFDNILSPNILTTIYLYKYQDILSISIIL